MEGIRGGGGKEGGTPKDKYLAWHVGQALTGSFRNGIIPPEVLAPLAEGKKKRSQARR